MNNTKDNSGYPSSAKEYLDNFKNYLTKDIKSYRERINKKNVSSQTQMA